MVQWPALQPGGRRSVDESGEQWSALKSGGQRAVDECGEQWPPFQPGGQRALDESGEQRPGKQWPPFQPAGQRAPAESGGQWPPFPSGGELASVRLGEKSEEPGALALSDGQREPWTAPRPGKQWPPVQPGEPVEAREQWPVGRRSPAPLWLDNQDYPDQIDDEDERRSPKRAVMIRRGRADAKRRSEQTQALPPVTDQRPRPRPRPSTVYVSKHAAE